MKKTLLVLCLLAVAGSAFAHETAYTCSREAKNGFVTPDIEYDQFTNHGKPYIYMKEIDGSEAYYRYDSLWDLENGGVYSGDRKSVISISSDKKYPLIVHYQDETKSFEYHCTLDAEMNSVIAGREKREAKEAAEAKAMQEKSDAEAQAEIDAMLAAQKKAAAEAKANAAREQAQAKREATQITGQHVSGASAVAISQYANQVRADVQENIYDADQWQGKQCTVKITIGSDGVLTSGSSEAGDTEFCGEVLATLSKMQRLPRPPSQGVYEAMKTMHLVFKL
ncbi:cell envelope integrity protein TolA [Klebsiella pneumoniae]|uniref:cell envelope integrity protein TolA n=1 Tax=Klebsiella pneumoniae TaxID=573 RepID=UPI002FF18595